MPEDTPDGPDGSPQQSPRPNGPPSGSLGAIIGQFKSRITKCVWALPANEKSPIWQRNDYESIVRDKTHFKRIWAYIENNPRQWEADQLHPAAPPNRFNRDTIQE